MTVKNALASGYKSMAGFNQSVKQVRSLNQNELSIFKKGQIIFYKRKYKKYNNVETKVSGYFFSSKLEAAVNNLLQLKENTGFIKILRRQQHVHFYFKEAKICEYWPDFTCLDLATKEIFFVEAKGKSDNADWRIKYKMWCAGGPSRLEIYGGNYNRPYLVETLYPRYPGEMVHHDQVFSKIEGTL
jgi:hypothetical protein